MSGSFDSPFGFTGEQTDANGLTYLRARYLNSALGNFISRDPFEGMVCQPMSLNGYSWVSGNAVNKVDPSGLSECAMLTNPVDMVECTLETCQTSGLWGTCLAALPAVAAAFGIVILLQTEGSTVNPNRNNVDTSELGLVTQPVIVLPEIDPDIAMIIGDGDFSAISPSDFVGITLTDFGRRAGIPSIDLGVPYIWNAVDARRLAGLCNGACLSQEEVEYIRRLIIGTGDVITLPETQGIDLAQADISQMNRRIHRIVAQARERSISHQPGCPTPCPPPPPPEIDRVPPSRPHYCPGDHFHVFIVNQSPPPECACRITRMLGGCLEQGGMP